MSHSRGMQIAKAREKRGNSLDEGSQHLPEKLEKIFNPWAEQSIEPGFFSLIRAITVKLLYKKWSAP